ncbi:MAG: hypothetical protein AAB019_12550 [Planctomycetota bacterium]
MSTNKFVPTRMREINKIFVKNCMITYLSKNEMRALDKLKSSYGGAKIIAQTIEEKRDYQLRKSMVEKQGFGNYLNDAERFARQMPKAGAYIKENKLKITKKATATTQVSAWQGCKITHHCLKRTAETVRLAHRPERSRRNGTIFLPNEMISVMPLTDDYVYGGDLLTTLAMTENLMGAKFCSSSLLGTPLPAHRFDRIKKVTGVALDTIDAGNGMSQLKISNMGTFFGNFCGIEVGNDNHLVYLDSITRTALETGSNFFLNPSWATITSALYYTRNIPNISFKISCFLGLHNLIQFRVLLNIIKEFKRKDGTSPIREINLGNAINAEKFIACHDLLKTFGLKGISLTAHICINQDLGCKNFNWFDNALEVLEQGYNLTLKYESDGEGQPDDTIMSYFLPKEDRESKSEVLGDVLYKKVLKCDEDSKKLLKMGYEVKFAEISEK